MAFAKGQEVNNAPFTSNYDDLDPHRFMSLMESNDDDVAGVLRRGGPYLGLEVDAQLTCQVVQVRPGAGPTPPLNELSLDAF